MKAEKCEKKGSEDDSAGLHASGGCMRPTAPTFQVVARHRAGPFSMVVPGMLFKTVISMPLMIVGLVVHWKTSISCQLDSAASGTQCCSAVGANCSASSMTSSRRWS
eukprot:621012-Rhodomonas_salina.3